MAVVELNIQAKREAPIPPPPPEGGIVLELGKKYRNGAGNLIGPMVEWHLPTHEGRPVLRDEVSGSVYFADDGRYIGLHGSPHKAHLVEEVWKYEAVEAAWIKGEAIEYMDPTGEYSPVGKWGPISPYQITVNTWGEEYAKTHLRKYKNLNFRIKP